MRQLKFKIIFLVLMSVAFLQGVVLADPTANSISSESMSATMHEEGDSTAVLSDEGSENEEVHDNRDPDPPVSDPPSRTSSSDGSFIGWLAAIVSSIY